jgi:hypothetical protein
VIGNQLAIMFTIQITANEIFEIMEESDRQVEEGNFDMLDTLHHFTSGLKALSTSYAYFGIDELR